MTDSDSSVDRTPGRLVVLAIGSLVLSLIAALGFVLALRFDKLWQLVLLPIAVPAVLVVAAIAARALSRSQRHGHAKQRAAKA